MHGVKLALLEYGGELDGTDTRDGVTGASVAGVDIELVIEGSDATPDVAVEATRRMVEQDGAEIIIGPLSGDEGLALKDYIRDFPDVTLVNGTSASQDLTLRDPAPNVFRFGGDGAMWTFGVGTYAYEVLGHRRIATVAEDYSYPYDQVGRRAHRVLRGRWHGFRTDLGAAGDAGLLVVRGADSRRRRRRVLRHGRHRRHQLRQTVRRVHRPGHPADRRTHGGRPVGPLRTGGTGPTG